MATVKGIVKHYIMEAIDHSDITIPQIHSMTGVMGTPADNFVVCKDFRWEHESTEKSYRTDASAVILCRKGSARIRVNFNETVIEEGCMMLYGPRTIVTILEKNDDTACDFLFFSADFIKDARFDLEMIMPIYHYVSEDASSLLKLESDECALIEQYYTILRDSMQFGKQHILQEIVSVMFRTIGELYSRRIEDGKHIGKTRQQEYFERFVKQVAAFYREQRSVKFYADSLYITPKYLSTVIKEISGRSAAEWINEFVIQEAKILLNYSTKSIQEITYELNFSTQSFFGKYFKRHTGTSPSEFRSMKNM